jgi:PLD-like domain
LISTRTGKQELLLRVLCRSTLAIGASAPILPASLVASGVALAVCFAPEEDCTAFAIRAIDNAEREILVGAYGLTTGSGIVEALVRAKDRGVDVQLIADKTTPCERESGIEPLAAAGVPVWIDNQARIAHSKTIVIDGAVTLTGSMNWTRGAAANSEDLNLVSSQPLLRSTRRCTAVSYRRRGVVWSLPSSVLPVGHLRLARPFNWEERNEPEDSGAFLALWRGPSIRRVRCRSEPRSNGRGPNAKYLPARPDVRHRAGQVRGGAARGQMPGGPGVRRSDQTNRCVTPRSAVRCPEGQEFDAQTNRCVTARSAVRCPEGQEFDARTNRCVTSLTR